MPNAKPNPDAHALLVRAYGSAFGIVIWARDSEAVRHHLYEARSESGDQMLKNLEIRQSPYDPEHEIWIVKRKDLPMPEDLVVGDES